MSKCHVEVKWRGWDASSSSHVTRAHAAPATDLRELEAGCPTPCARREIQCSKHWPCDNNNPLGQCNKSAPTRHTRKHESPREYSRAACRITINSQPPRGVPWALRGLPRALKSVPRNTKVSTTKYLGHPATCRPLFPQAAHHMRLVRAHGPSASCSRYRYLSVCALPRLPPVCCTTARADGGRSSSRGRCCSRRAGCLQVPLGTRTVAAGRPFTAGGM